MVIVIICIVTVLTLAAVLLCYVKQIRSKLCPCLPDLPEEEAIDLEQGQPQQPGRSAQYNPVDASRSSMPGEASAVSSLQQLHIDGIQIQLVSLDRQR